VWSPLLANDPTNKKGGRPKGLPPWRASIYLDLLFMFRRRVSQPFLAASLRLELLCPPLLSLLPLWRPPPLLFSPLGILIGPPDECPAILLAVTFIAGD
jgi:hypothetical protein